MVNICRNMLLGSQFITHHFIKRGGLTSTVFHWSPVPSQETERSCICVLQVSDFASFYDFYVRMELFWQCDIFCHVTKPGKWTVMYLCVSGHVFVCYLSCICVLVVMYLCVTCHVFVCLEVFDFASFYDFSVRFWNCSDREIYFTPFYHIKLYTIR
jgi:hypothetical protein